VVNTVSAKAIKVAVINYYSTLGLLSVVKKAVDLATALRFEPINFSPADTRLNDAAQAYLDKVSSMLHERPGLHIVICGHVTNADRDKILPQTELTGSADSAPLPDTASDAIEVTETVKLSDDQLDKLLQLARQRGEKTKEYLVTRKGIGADRLILCNPVYTAETDRPFVQIKL